MQITADFVVSSIANQLLDECKAKNLEFVEHGEPSSGRRFDTFKHGDYTITINTLIDVCSVAIKIQRNGNPLYKVMPFRLAETGSVPAAKEFLAKCIDDPDSVCGTFISKFEGPHEFLSNSFKHPITIKKIKYPTVEHAYQASKTKNIKLKQSMSKMSVADVIARGNKIKTTESWNNTKFQILYWLLTRKFKNAKLAQQLIDTKDSVITYDNTANGDATIGLVGGYGFNRLGDMLMEIRYHLINAPKKVTKK